MNESMAWAQVSKCYEQPKVVDDINESGLWAQDSRCMQSSSLVMTWTTLGHELKALDAIQILGCGWFKPL